MNKEAFGSFLLGIGRIGRACEGDVSGTAVFSELRPGFAIDDSVLVVIPDEVETLVGFDGASGSVRPCATILTTTGVSANGFFIGGGFALMPLETLYDFATIIS